MVKRWEMFADLDGAERDRGDAVTARNAIMATGNDGIDLVATGGTALQAETMKAILNGYIDAEYAADRHRSRRTGSATTSPTPNCGAAPPSGPSTRWRRSSTPPTTRPSTTHRPPSPSTSSSTSTPSSTSSPATDCAPNPPTSPPPTPHGPEATPHRVCRCTPKKPSPQPCWATSAGSSSTRGTWSSTTAADNDCSPAPPPTPPACSSPAANIPAAPSPLRGARSTTSPNGRTTARTDQDNAAIMCGHHNRHKHRHKLTARRDLHGHIRIRRPDGTWITPAGCDPPHHTHLDTPEQHAHTA